MKDITNDNVALPRAPLDITPRRRFFQISWFFLRLLVHVYLFDILASRFAPGRYFSQKTAVRRWSAIARRFRALAIAKGGVLIKLGQFLSARADILPAAVTDELAGLQDEVPPAPFPYILQTLHDELGPPAQVFATFDTKPIAAASFGQVYFGTLPDGREVAIKVQRPRIGELVEIDLRAVRWAVRLIKNYPLIRRRANLEALFDEFGRVLWQELDYVQEAANARTFRSNFAGTPHVHFPEPYSDVSTGRVLVMERVSGIKISDYAALRAAGIDMPDLAARFNNAYQKQFFLDGFFHADPHPGNLLIRVDGPPGPDSGAPYTIMFLDSGMVGQITPAMVRHLRDGLIGIAQGDAQKMVDGLDGLNMILPGADRRQIMRAVQIFLRYTYDRNMTELAQVDVNEFFGEISHLIRDLPFQIPQDLIYLGRAVSMVGGIATGIDPHLNVFELSRPFAQELIERERRETDWAAWARREVGGLAQIAATLPRQMDGFYRTANRGELQVQVDMTRLEDRMRRVERATVRLGGLILSASMVLGGAALRINALATEATWAWGLAALVGIWALWPRR